MCALFISGGVVSAPRNADLDDLRAAAEKGNPAAANAYAEVLVELHRFADSLPWFEVAADAGITNAQWRLGHMYLRGIRAAGSQNVAERPADGFRWLQHAALQGHKHAQLDLGRAYHEGFGTAKNAHEALFWFCIAAEHGLVRARESRDKLMFALPRAEVQDVKQRAREFRPAARDAKSVLWDGIKVNGISGPADKRLAIVNGQTLAQGEQRNVKIAGRTMRLRCVEISQSAVIVELVDLKEVRRLPAQP